MKNQTPRYDRYKVDFNYHVRCLAHLRSPSSHVNVTVLCHCYNKRCLIRTQFVDATEYLPKENGKPRNTTFLLKQLGEDYFSV